ncbi:Gfo/Idh/MocA family oxidoreductase [Pseudovibrio sp. Tun.PSC04-5.I4]|uniref:Gfo/Idh/MocA family protein n=1 Tax=Pseudovibrio sp. Tun.PSC04-5.I4 TaxID=1798213 RepID=UPI0008919AB9|nr:Gfo/Idh/MocA family oxidoreductase [Pseudovibrio sp. Tun.PSC04-5.I4]SDQ15935.1 Predicted dehydrogenase [Pseudovibrio sp. Tun.PSC04-5.I4]
MVQAEVIRLGVVGCGHIATEQVAQWEQTGKVKVVCGVEPNEEQFQRFSQSLTNSDPKFAKNIEAMLQTYGSELDAVYIATPHAFHAAPAKAALTFGLNVLLEKPMAFTAEEAEAIQAAVEASGKTLVVSFNGSLSPKMRAASAALARGDFGKIHTIAGLVSENWSGLYEGHWKQKPEISGGGFLLDTGSHALNAIIDVAGCGIESVSAQFSEKHEGCEISAVLSGRMQNGALVSLTACGDTAPPCLGELTLFCEKAVVRIDPWGKRPAMVRTSAEEPEQIIEFGEEKQLIDLFISVCNGEMENPSPVERNVEFARLWAATRASASQKGAIVHVKEVVGA